MTKPDSTEKYCSECGKIIKRTAEICPKCGVRQMKKEEVTKDKIKCPKCGSMQIHVDKEGYSAGKGCCGALAFGPFGLLCGQSGANKIKKTCLKCNHSWV